MHDPYTMIGRLGPIVLWHRDKGGCDGACGWTYPRLTEKQVERVKSFAWMEAHHPVFQAAYGKSLESAADAESLMRGLIVILARVLRVRLTMDEVSILALELAHQPGNNFRSGFAFLPGWHSNREEDTPDAREYHAEQLCFGVARQVLRLNRKWWQHPRWHFWHWRIQIRGILTQLT